jgi:adenylate kinase
MLAMILVAACGGEGRSGSEADSVTVHRDTKGQMQIIIIGPPGAGKGTQAEKIAQRFDIPHISTGSMLRDEVARGTELGARVREVMERGDLVSDDIMLDLIEGRLSREDCRRGFILDGFPRTIPQAEGLEAILRVLGHTGIRVLDIDVPEAELITRMLKRKRADDTEETIRRRIKVYHQNTAPLIEYYEKRSEVVRVDGNGSIDGVFREIERALMRE